MWIRSRKIGRTSLKRMHIPIIDNQPTIRKRRKNGIFVTSRQLSFSYSLKIFEQDNIHMHVDTPDFCFLPKK